MQCRAVSRCERVLERAAGRSLTVAALSAALCVALLSVLLCGCDAQPAAPVVAPAEIVHAALDRRIAIDVADEPLGEVLARLLEDAEVPLVNRAERRWPADYRRDEPVTLRLTDVRLESALRWLLLPRGLDYVVGESGTEAGGLRIVGSDDVGEFVVRTYPVADIVALDGGWCDESALAEAIESLVAPGAWPPTTGEGYVQDMPGAMTIAGPPEVHRRTERLLADIRQAADPHQQGDVLSPVLSPPSESEQRIAAALERPISMDIGHTSMTELGGMLRRDYGLNVVLDRSALTEGSSTPAAHLLGVPLHDALDLLLQRSEWRIESESLWIYSAADQPTAVSTRVYPLAGLRWEYDDPAYFAAQRGMGSTLKNVRTAWFDGEDLIDLITAVVEPDTWENIGGAGTIVEVPGGLAVSQSRSVHDRLSEFLARVAWASDPYRTLAEPEASPAFAGLEEALDKSVSIAWEGQQLQPALLRLLEADCGLDSVFVDYEALGGLERSLRVSFHAADISLRSALSLVLNRVGLAFSNRNGVLVIASDVDVAHRLSLRAYRVPDDYGQAFQLVVDHVRPLAWTENGDAIRAFPDGLVISQADAVHAEVRAVLSDAGLLPRDESIPRVEPEHVRRIKAALAAPVTLEAADRPLGEFVEELARQHGIQVLSDGGAMPDVRLNGRFAHVPLGEVLRQLLAPYDLFWTVRHESLLIVDAVRAEWLLTTRFYPIAGRAACSATMLTRFFAPYSWNDDDGVGVVTELPHGLVVSQTESLHAEVQRLLDALMPPSGDAEAVAAEQARFDALHAEADSFDVALLPAALADRSPRVRLLGLYLLCEWDDEIIDDPDVEAALAALVALLRAPEREVRLAAIATAPSLAGTGHVTAPALVDAWRLEEDAYLRAAILEALAALGPEAAGAWTELLYADPGTIERAFRQLAELGPTAGIAVRELIVFLRRSDDETFRKRVCETFDAIGPAADAAVPDLVAIIAAEAFHGDTVQAACEALGSIAARPEIAVPALIDVVEGDKFRDLPRVRAAACVALGAFAGEADRIIPVLMKAHDDPDPAVHTAAAIALGPLQLQDGLSEPEDE